MGIYFEFANRDRLHGLPFGHQESVCDHVLEHSTIEIFQMLKMTSQNRITKNFNSNKPIRRKFEPIGIFENLHLCHP